MISLSNVLLPCTESKEAKFCSQEQEAKGPCLTQLAVKIVTETATALMEGRLKVFDALIRNFGCQMTALQVKELAENQAVKEEAAQLFQSPTEGVSTAIAQLMRFRFLSIVNHNKLNEKGREVPVTNLEPLCEMASGLSSHFLKKLVTAIQIDESKRAVDFIQRKAGQLPTTFENQLVQRVLSSSIRTSFSGIRSSPLLFNTLAVIRALSGPILLKRKCDLCGVPIADITSFSLVVKMPQEEVVEESQRATLDADAPILVIEGFIKETMAVTRFLLESGGLMRLIQANCTLSGQFASSTSQGPLEDLEGEAFVNSCKKESGLADLFEIDHIFCSTLKQECR